MKKQQESRSKVALLSAAVVSALYGVSASAQLEEVIVTAQKREQSIQDVPISVTAFSGEELREFRFNDLRDLTQQTPNMSLAGYNESKPEIVIRGYAMSDLFTALDASPVGVYNDEVYIGARSGLLSQMYDLERVEVLRGPQGTLWGRNTTGGAVHFVSNKPDPSGEVNGYVTATVAEQDQFDIEGAISVPLVDDVLALRVSGIRRDMGGYTKNAFTGGDLDGVDSWAARAQLVWTPSESATWRLAIEGSDSEVNGPAWHTIGMGNNEPSPTTGYVDPPGFHTVSTDFPPLNTTEKAGISLQGTIDLDWFGGTTFTTISNYQTNDTQYRSDWDGQSFDLGRDTLIQDDTEQWSQELRLASNSGERLNWTLGFYYYSDEVDGSQHQTVFGGFFDIFNDYVQGNDAWAVFGNMDYALSEDLTLRLGLRYTDEEKDMRANATDSFGTPAIVDFNDSESWTEPTGSIGLDWSVSEDALVYASVSRGFKSGGYNGAAFNDASEVGPFDPELNDAYELGAKTTWMDGKLRVNGAVFYNDIEDIQALVPAGVFFLVIDNASSATLQGAELEVYAQPTDRLNFSFTASFLDTEYGDYFNQALPVAYPDVTIDTNLRGNELPHSPSEKFSGMIQYNIPFIGGSTLTPRFEFTHSGDRYLSSPNRPIDQGDSFTVMNARLKWADANDRWQATLWVTNLDDEQYALASTGSLAFFGLTGSATERRGQPRTLGLTLNYNFN